MVTISYRQRFNKDYFEEQAWSQNRFICGIDEVGRGSLAGPVVAAAAILFVGKKSKLVKDSKLLDQKELQAAYRWLANNCWYGTAILHNRIIHSHNIYHATLKAMMRALMQLFTHCPQKPDKILIDAMPLNLLDTSYRHIEVLHFPSGERKSSSIAAASIIAKVTRDKLMNNLDPLFPQYKFCKHKGYGTQLHNDAIRQNGRSIIHRPKYLENQEFEAQLQEQQNFLTISS